METCQQFVFVRIFVFFPNSSKTLRSSAIVKNLGANWHLKIMLNVCLLKFFVAYGFRLGKSCRHVSPIHLHSAEREKSFRRWAQKSPISIPFKHILYLHGNLSFHWPEALECHETHQQLISLPSGLVALPCCRHWDLPEGGALPWPRLPMSWRPNAKGFLNSDFQLMVVYTLGNPVNERMPPKKGTISKGKDPLPTIIIFRGHC